MSESPLVEELGSPPDPVEACARFNGLPYLVFLDSSAEHAQWGRHSFLSADPAILIRGQGVLTQQSTASSGDWVRVAGDPLGAAERLLARYAVAPVAGLPPFQGGVAGYLTYDWGAGLERIPRTRFSDCPTPDVMLGVYDWVIAWDNVARRAWIVSTGLPALRVGRARRAEERLRWVKGLLTGGRAMPAEPRARPSPQGAAPSYAFNGMPEARGLGLRSNFTAEGYRAAVARVIEYIRAGDIFQANLAQRFQAPLVGTPFELYRRLRDRNPAPFSAYLDFDGVAIASSSPERFLRVEEGRVEARPIKGTRPRGRDPAADAALALALSESAKDRAENVMIVDVLRNDLSRVCAPGTVSAPELFAVERYATVQHLVSTVVGELAPGRATADLLRAAFPSGSVTGAPKVRAMQIVAELEPTPRRVYCGAIGYWSVTGAVDTSVAIRTCLVVGDEVYFQAGGGIVADSRPHDEYDETIDKALGMIAAVAP